MATYVLNFQGLADYAQHFASGLALTAELAVAATAGGIYLCAKKGGCATVIASGYVDDVLLKIVNGEDVGTYIHPDKRLTQRERWLLNTTYEGAIVVDDGAVQALHSHKSLLPSGIIAVKGVFSAGEVAAIMDKEGKVFAKAAPYFDSTELELVQGHKSSEIAAILGEGRKDVIFRPEDLVFMDNE